MTEVAESAARLLGNEIRLARQRRGWTITELAARAGVSARTTLLIEQGAPSVSIGNVFNVAARVGVSLFTENPAELARTLSSTSQQIALLPARVRVPRQNEVHGEFDF